MRRAALIGIAVIVTALSAWAQPVPPLTGRVVDIADILSPHAEAEITALLRAHEDSTGNQIAVLTIPSLDGAVLEEFATTVFRTWGLGEEDRNNGVLILIARDDRKIRIEVGFGLEGALTDASSGAVIRNEMTPRFRDGDFSGGTLAAAQAVVQTLDGTYEARSDQEGGNDDMPPLVAVILACTHGLLPMALGFASLKKPFAARYAIVGFTSLFVAAAAGVLSEVLFKIPFVLAALGGFAAYLMLYIAIDLAVSRSPVWQERRAHERRKAAAFKKARASGRTSVFVDGHSYTVPTSSGGSSGGFSGGGGSSGGGGASGGW